MHRLQQPSSNDIRSLPHQQPAQVKHVTTKITIDRPTNMHVLAGAAAMWGVEVYALYSIYTAHMQQTDRDHQCSDSSLKFATRLVRARVQTLTGSLLQQPLRLMRCSNAEAPAINRHCMQSLACSSWILLPSRSGDFSSGTACKMLLAGLHG